MYDLSKDSKSIQQLAAQAIDKVNDLELTINSIKHKTDRNEKINLKTPLDIDYTHNISKDTAKQALGALTTAFDFKKGEASLTIDDSTKTFEKLPENVQSICNSLYTIVDGSYYLDILKILTLLVAANK
jgi:hypothetical protein